ncbi:nickel pincer cofactor biosynthesis protein LarC [Nocardioides sp. CER19]|uniref:nickel pincer cofactor biosynthesis protein LarC n=1 Tax=Nocardioides sp. CER19 TaxID=3038538 RepID=UPI00244D05D3|nr:nickel pincer cofactor biosynthesis protein LarC [Nocardioides sp. CER19]MDH2416972.1 nickel pincer cofactor biosynthesis protein LarC [Nocardioides sp. CER19]
MTRSTRVGWLDAGSGVSGDMLLGACVDAGVPVEVLQQAVDRLGLPERVALSAEQVTRAGVGGTRVFVEVDETRHHRRLGDILALLEALEPPLRERAAAVFRALAAAEAAVHRVSTDEVEFHEVGALDSIADVVGAVAGLHWLGLDRLVCSPIALGGGRVRAAHGSLPVPAPAVLELLRGAGAPSLGGPIDRELATPTGVAVLVTLADGFGPMPPLVPELTGAGAGAADPESHPNLLRLVVGDASAGDSPVPAGEPAVVLEANVDDLDPRLWPGVLTGLLDAGADDAWLTPIVMKKGRPAHTVSVLASPDRADALARVLLTRTSTIGLRRHALDKLPLPRKSVEVDVLGSSVRVKVAWLDGAVVNASPEYDDVARVAAATGLPEKAVLAAAVHAAHELWGHA